MKTIRITNFNLTYEGMYFIFWGSHKYRVFLDLGTILKMLRLEGWSNEEVIRLTNDVAPLHFSKVTLSATGDSEGGRLSLLTSDFSEEYLGKRNLSMVDVELAD